MLKSNYLRQGSIRKLQLIIEATPFLGDGVLQTDCQCPGQRDPSGTLTLADPDIQFYSLTIKCSREFRSSPQITLFILPCAQPYARWIASLVK